ncbi:MAG: hypothetical protein NZM11_12880, partial [Anaerolineales bacterium]|nr:hypothetical protein [Anaerolineales bacterium]
ERRADYWQEYRSLLNHTINLSVNQFVSIIFRQDSCFPRARIIVYTELSSQCWCNHHGSFQIDVTLDMVLCGVASRRPHTNGTTTGYIPRGPTARASPAPRSAAERRQVQARAGQLCL